MLYNVYCRSCHQWDGRGDNNRYPPLAGSEWVSGSRERLIGIVLHGLQGEIKVSGKTYNGVMPAHGDFLDDYAVASILTFINKRFNQKDSVFTNEEIKKVRGAR
jgi:mono/diheme cytochrome c family protein